MPTQHTTDHDRLIALLHAHNTTVEALRRIRRRLDDGDRAFEAIRLDIQQLVSRSDHMAQRLEAAHQVANAAYEEVGAVMRKVSDVEYAVLGPSGMQAMLKDLTNKISLVTDDVAELANNVTRLTALFDRREKQLMRILSWIAGVAGTVVAGLILAALIAWLAL